MRYIGHGWPNRASPTSGMSLSSGTRVGLATLVTASHRLSRNNARPSTNRFSVSPTTNWSIDSRWLRLACTSDTATPAAVAATRPTAIASDGLVDGECDVIWANVRRP